MHLTPDRFTLTNPDWQEFIEQTLGKVQQELGLEKQKLQAHLYDLLLYEPGSFFLPHRDSEKLDRMVATLVVVLPSSYEGGELVVRHEGQERTIDFSSDENPFRTHYAAFYADCEHEIRPLTKGYRLCLVYNLTLTKSKTKKGITAPRRAEHIKAVAEVLREWVTDKSTEAPRKLVVTLEHQYTQEGLAWDALKGVDRSRAQILLEGAEQAGCQALLALLTFHETYEAEDYGGYGYGYGRGRRRDWDDYDDEDEDEEEEDEEPEYAVGELIDSDLSAEHWSDSQGNRLSIGLMNVEKDELVDPDSLEDVDPEEEFEGYTGNAGNTLDRWYRHGAIVLWPDDRHFDILCDAGSGGAVAALALLVKEWKQASKKEAEALRARCIEFATTIMQRWSTHTYYHPITEEDEDKQSPLLQALVALDEPALFKTFLSKVLTRDTSVYPGKTLVKLCEKHGWRTFLPELETVCSSTTASTTTRNIRLLELICQAGASKKDGWKELCEVLARAIVAALQTIDTSGDWQARELNRVSILAALARTLLANGQDELLSRLLDHTLALPRMYPATTVQIGALTMLQPWLKQNVKKRPAALSHWLASVRKQLEAFAGEEPQPPADYRRDAAISCKCVDCRELKRFLEDPNEQVHRFPAAQDRRKHLERMIQQHHLDLNTSTDRETRPHTLVCTKTTASYQARLKAYHRDREHLGALREIETGLPK
jgi:hypothetical protein